VNANVQAAPCRRGGVASLRPFSYTAGLDGNTKRSHNSDIHAPHAIAVISLACKFRSDRNYDLNENIIPES
jgi:hypothetical protein